MESMTSVGYERIEFTCNAAASRRVTFEEDLNKPYRWSIACGSLIPQMATDRKQLIDQLCEALRWPDIKAAVREAERLTTLIFGDQS